MFKINNKIKILRILFYIVFALIMLEGFGYINILVSEKYEVDLLETNYKVQGIKLPDKNIVAKKKEIAYQKKINKISLIVTSILLITIFSAELYLGRNQSD